MWNRGPFTNCWIPSPTGVSAPKKPTKKSAKGRKVGTPKKQSGPRKVFPRLAQKLYAVYVGADEGELAAHLIDVFTSKREADRCRARLRLGEEKHVVVVSYAKV